MFVPDPDMTALQAFVTLAFVSWVLTLYKFSNAFSW